MKLQYLFSTLVIGCLLVFSAVGQTQMAPGLEQQLRDRLDGKETLYEIMNEVDAFYETLSEDARNGKEGVPKLKFWKRWEHYWSSRLGPNGEFVNITQRMFDATQQRLQASNSRNSAISGDWEFIGASESSVAFSGVYNGVGRVDRIAFHPTDANIIYVGAPAGGLWKTTDGGTTWEAKSDYIGSLGIGGIVVDHANPNTVYILTGDGDSSTPNSFVSIFGYIRPSIGVLKSTDGGDTWGAVAGFPGVTDPYFGYELKQHPTNANILYAATTEGLFKTTNGGASWVLARSGNHFDVEFTPDGSRVYTVDANGFYYSLNVTNNTWGTATYNNPPLVNGRKAIGVSPANGNSVYFLAGGDAIVPGNYSGTFLSNDQGVSFTRMSTTPNILGTDGSSSNEQSIYDHCIAISPTAILTVITGGLCIWRSVGGGITWTNIAPYQGNPDAQYSVHPDIHALAYNPLDGKLYACSDGGVHVSSDNGDNFTDLTKGLQLTQAYHFDMASDREYRVTLGTQDNGVKYRPAATEDFQHVVGGDGFYPSFVAGSDDEFYVSINGTAYWLNMTTLQWEEVSPNGQFYKVYEAHPTDPNIVFCGGKDIWKSTNKGFTWSNKCAAGSWAMAFAPSDPTRMYAVGRETFEPGNGTMYRSDDSGETWTEISANPGFPTTATKITDIMVRPGNPDEVWVTCGGFTAGQKVYFSTDGGNNWSDSSFPGVPNIPINCIAWAAPNHVFLGTDNGVYHKLNTSVVWDDVSDNLPNVPVTGIQVDESTGTLYVSTFGRGMWEYPFCVDNINLTAGIEGVIDYESSNSIMSTSEIGNDADTEVRLQSTKIELKPGFHAKEGSRVNAKAGPCTENSLPN